MLRVLPVANPIMKKLALVVVVLLLAWAVAAPYLTVYRMKVAADARDGEALSQHIDFPSVRQSFKDQLNARMLGEAKPGEQGSGLKALGASFAGVVVDRMVDAYVTPAAIGEMMRGAPADAPAPTRDESPSPPPDAEQAPLADARMGYRGLSRFVIEVEERQKGETAQFVLRRRGLGWQLTEILLP